MNQATMMTKQQFSDHIEEQTSLRLGEDYTIEVGTYCPYKLEGMQSAGMFEGFRMTIPDYKQMIHFTKQDLSDMTARLKMMTEILTPYSKRDDKERT